MGHQVRPVAWRYMPFIVLALVVIIPFLPLVLAARWGRGRWLAHRWERTWSCRGKRVLLVYSRSPVWRAHIETRWLPKVGAHAVLVDWSDRSTWSPRALEVRAFRHWAGEREFNPIAICFPVRGRVRTIRFWRAFRDWKHGKPYALERAEAELFAFVAALRTADAGASAGGTPACS